jgi:hypothetical protein
MAELQLETQSADPIAKSRAKLAAAEEYIKDRLAEKKVTLALADNQEIPLPVTQVQLLTGINATNNTLDLRVEVPDLNVVGERKVADVALDVLKTIPILSKNFDLEQKAPQTPANAAEAGENTAPKPATESKLPPVAFSWGPDMKTVDIKFTFSKETDPLAIIDEIYAMRVARDQEKLRAANQPQADIPAININNTVMNSGPVGDAAPVAKVESVPVTEVAPTINAEAAPVAGGFAGGKIQPAATIAPKSITPEGISGQPRGTGLNPAA